MSNNQLCDTSGDMAGLEPYKYDRLSNPEEIRCLRLEPGQGDEPLSCTLKAYRLDEDPQYEAISYVWGTSNRSHEIQCDGLPLFITPNLRDALQQCRLSDRSRLLWADSICIDQDNDGEKSHQVFLMSKIYSQAMRVLICFGSDQTGRRAQEAYSLLYDVNEIFERFLTDSRGIYDSFPWPDNDDPLLSDSRWSSLLTLQEHPWFRRGWVVQEASLAKDALLLFGSVEVHWLWVLRLTAWVMSRTRTIIRVIAHGSFTLHTGKYASRNREEAVTLAMDQDDHDLLMILDNGRHLDVTDDRDRIYAFLGLPEAAEIRDSLSINYGQTVHQVYQDFACCYLDKTDDLTLLHYVQHTEASISADFESPSWIPQWYHKIFSWSIHDPLKQRIESLHHTELPPYSIMENSILRVKGLSMDSITFVSPQLSESTTVSDITTIWRAVLRHKNGPIYDRFPPVHAFWEAMMCSRVVGGLSFGQLQAHINAYIRHLDPSALFLGGEDAKVWDATEDDLNSPESLLGQLISWIIHNRRIAVTQRGYYCLVPGLACEGDTCAVISGTNGPFILRNTGRHHYYKVVGETFVVSRQEVDIELGERPDSVGDGQDWLDYDLEEEDIYLC
ncbi:Heterokaryon incompatibility protein 6, OR allele [Cytospora mali]|uniref:Heterokaryon incompatibility protein 6, OR allele n=1 Tax=Cytospora mali TaxID=578113 RepID=A0A194W9T9_CYTMA|nr:Heterokaryon incompatibility protein 6, OR allele [Valsa mali]